jgi:hypothetical protein
VIDGASFDWPRVTGELDVQGWSLTRGLLSSEQCAECIDTYDQSSRFRSRVIMSRHGFGRGEYQYFDYPLPPLIQTLRGAMYCELAALANDWHRRMRLPGIFPETHAQFLQRCHSAGQALPTPLLLKYGPGDYNCLHQDLYGEHVFPVQAAILLSRPGIDFTGGEFVLTEQRPRMQTRASVPNLRQGDVLLFAVRHRPVRGSRGEYRVNQRHGVSALDSGRRFVLGIIFHDAGRGALEEKVLKIAGDPGISTS